MYALRFPAAAVLFFVPQLNTTLAPTASGKDESNPRSPDTRYATATSVPGQVRNAGRIAPGRMRIIAPFVLPAEIPCERIQVGVRMGYKPNVQRLSSRELAMLNFHTQGETQGAGDGPVREHTVIHRSKDNGRTWISKHVRDVYGREPYLSAALEG